MGGLEGEIGYEVELFEWNVVIVVGVVVDCGWWRCGFWWVIVCVCLWVGWWMDVDFCGGVYVVCIGVGWDKWYVDCDCVCGFGGVYCVYDLYLVYVGIVFDVLCGGVGFVGDGEFVCVLTGWVGLGVFFLFYCDDDDGCLCWLVGIDFGCYVDFFVLYGFYGVGGIG